RRASINSWLSSRWWARSCSWAAWCSGSCRARRPSLDESRHRLERKRRLIAVRRVLALGKHPPLERARDAALDRVELGQRAVLVVCALERRHGRARARQIFLDGPGRKGGSEPDVVPAPERMVGVVVVAREALGKIRGAVGGLCLFDAGDGHVLDEDMRRLQD